MSVAVIGDLMLDEYVYGDVHRISPESASPVLHVRRVERMIGGAGNVAHGVAALGCHVELVGVVGQDEAGRELMWTLDAVNNRNTHLVPSLVSDPDRQTTVKTRYVSDAHSAHMLRVDREGDGRITNSEALRSLSRRAHYAIKQAEIVVLSDYCKGVFTPMLAEMLVQNARLFGKYVIVDSKGDLSHFKGANCVKLNLCELGFCFDEPDEVAITTAANALAGRNNFDTVIVTRGENGLTAYDQQGKMHFPGKRVRVRDVSGAGDTVVATLAALLDAGHGEPFALECANRAASIAVSKPGTSIVSMAELRSGTRIAPAADWALLDQRIVEWRGQKIGFTNGCFDMLHPGHVHLLQTAAVACDRLIVGINSDAGVRALKGDDRPVQKEQHRADMLAALVGIVDLVVIFEGVDPTRLIERVRPAVLFKGEDYQHAEIKGREFGGEVQIIPHLLDGQSTTETINKIRGAACVQ